MSPAPSSTMIDTGDTFILTNEGDTVLDLTLLGRRYKVEPGKHALVPFELLRVYWGDPRTRNGVYGKFSDSKEKGFINKREDEIRRLGVLYGSYAADVRALMDPEWPRGSTRFGSPKRVPHPISVRTEGGDEVVPACFDETGDRVYAAVRNESEDLNDEVAYRQHLESQIDELRERLDRVAPAGESGSVAVDE